MASSSRSNTADIKRLLDRLVAAEKLPKDDMEEEIDRVAAECRRLPKDGIVAAVWKAAGQSQRRRQHGIFLLAEHYDSPEVSAHTAEWLQHPDPRWRQIVIQTLEQHRLVQLAPLLNAVIDHDADQFCQELALHAAGTLRHAVNLSSILSLAVERPPEDPGYLIWALKDYSTEECRVHLQRYFENPDTEKENRVVAAWGLSLLGNAAAFSYLVSMLDDPDRRTANGSFPGVSIRAAQAICAIKGWPFQWHVSAVGTTKARLTEGSAT